MNKLLFILFFSWFIPSLDVEKEKDSFEPTKLTMSSEVDETYKNVAAVTASNGNWSNPSTWSTNQLPGPSDQVTIPDFVTVILDVPNITVSHLNINGTLFVNRNMDINLTSNWILVNGTTALLDWGTANDPYLGNAVITLNGNDENYNFNGTMGNKFLGVMGGATLQMHGETKQSWTKIDQKAEIGAMSIHLLEPVDWEVGDQIVIASTDFDPHEAEKRTITAMSPDKRTLTLNAGLNYMHWGTLQSYKNGAFTLDERAEVGLLTRNIRVQGNTNSETTQFGGHMMSMITSKVYVAGVHFYRMGQVGRLGRYPFHWHLCQDVNGQYLKNSTIEKSWNRAVTIHGSDNALIEDNVAYDHIGHGFFLEDASETGNEFIGNLGLVSRVPLASQAIELHDIEIRAGRNLSPATFWITNNENTFDGNVAAGSDGTGFWFITPKHDFAGRRPNVNLFEQPFTKFDNNVAHSCLSLGVAFNGEFILDDNGVTTTEVESGNTTKTVAPNPHFYNNLIYKNEGNGLWTLTRAAVYEDWIFADNGASTFHVFHQTFENNLFVGRSANYGTLVGATDIALGYNLPDDLIIRRKSRFNAFAFYDGPLGLENCHFDGYNDEYSQIMQILGAAVVSCSSYSSGVTFGPDVSQDNILSYLSTGRTGIRGINHADGNNTSVFNDLDASMTGKAGAYSVKIVPPNTIYPYDLDYFKEPGATEETVWDAWYNPTAKFGIVEAKGVTVHTKETNIYATRLKNGTQFKTSLEEASKANSNHWKILNIMNDGYSYIIQPTEVSKSYRSMKLSNLGHGEYLDLDIINVPNAVTIQKFDANDTEPLNGFSSLTALRSQTNTTGYYVKDNTIHMRYVATNANNVYGDSYRTAESVLFNVIWADALAESWANQYLVPIAEFNTGVDSRGSLHANGDLQISPITQSGNNQFNVFSIYSDNDGVTEFTDYRMELATQVWTGMPTLNINFAGNWQPQVFIRDGTNYHYLGLLANGDNALSLANVNSKLWDVNQIVIRFAEDRKIGNGPSPTLINLHEITLGNGQGDSDGDGTIDEDELTECRDPNDPADLEFDFDTRDLGWSKHNVTAENFTSREYWLMRVDYQTDPRIERTGLDFQGSDFSQIHVRFKSQQAQNVELFWATAANNSFAATRKATFYYASTNDEWDVAVFDMSAHPEWVGQNITKLRFDMPSNVSKRIHTTIDYIRSENATFVTTMVDNTPCLGDLVEFSANVLSTDASDTYQWQYKDNDQNWNDIPGATTLLLSATTNTEQLHRIRVARNGCEQFSTPIEAEFSAPPSLTLPTNAEVCNEAGLVSLVATPEGGAWSGNGVVGNPIYINAGGPAVSLRGINWLADTYNNGGSVYSYPPTTQIENTVFNSLYHSERWDAGSLEYNIPVTNGEYTVQLHFAEAWPTAHTNGIRVFDIEVEGNTVQSNFDIFADAGPNTATIVSYNASVTDGNIDIDLLAIVQNPKINAIAILPRSFDPTSTFPGTRTLVYDYIDPENGCVADDAFTITVRDTPNPTVSPSTTVCESETGLAALTASLDGGVWSGAGMIGSPLYINAGATVPVSQGGFNWIPDQNFVNGNVAIFGAVVANTIHQDIYRTERNASGGDLQYQIPVPNGEYEVELHFAEMWVGAFNNGVRRFGIELEGTLVENSIDIYASVSREAALIKSYPVTVSDGILNLDLTKIIQNPKISGIVVLPRSFDPATAGTGVHPLTYDLRDHVTGCIGSKTINYTVEAAPVATTSAGVSTCSGREVTLTGNTSTSGSSISYEWYEAGTNNLLASTQNYTTTPTGDIDVELVVTVDGCPSFPSTPVTINVDPTNAVCFGTKSLLEGPSTGGGMGDNLKENGFLPLMEPYSGLGMPIDNPGVSLSSASVLNGVAAQDDIVDWVLVQFRDKNDPTSIVYSEAMLIDQTGQIFAYTNGRKTEVLSFPVAHDSYYLAIFHRNHLPVMSATPLVFNGVSSMVDFRLSSVATYGTGARVELATGLWGQITGDADNNNAVDAADRSSTWNNRNQSGYMLSDVTLDGYVDAADRSKTWNNRNKSGVVGQ